MTDYQCPKYTWCQAISPGHDEHDAATYVPASLSGPCRKNMTVGAGVVAATRGPSVFIHIIDETHVDEDAYMTVDEAVDLVDVVVAAIANARSCIEVSEVR